MWSQSTLWDKSKIFVERAMEEEDRNSPLFPFWCALSLEVLARSTLAKVHSSLLADTQYNSDSVLYACGIPGIKSPKSIATKHVFLRCNRIIEKFTEGDYKFSMLMMEKRNEELHTGATPFSSWSHPNWLTDYFRVCEVLLDFIGKDLSDFVGMQEATTALKMLQASRANKKDEAFKLIKHKRVAFSELPITERLEKIKDSSVLRARDYRMRFRGIEVDCPACEGAAVIVGEIIRSSNPRDEDGELIQIDQYLPEKLQCYSCELLLEGYEYLQGVGLGEPYQKRDILDPIEFYDIDPKEYIDEHDYY